MADDIPTEVSYRIVERQDKTFAVEVSVTDTNPTLVTPFQTSDGAQAWIDKHIAARAERSTKKSWRQRR